jgi:hypothetical protein
MYNIDTCAICRETLETSETRVLPCNHSYHKECIDSWLARVPSCPYCRTTVVIEGVTPRDWAQRPLPDDDIVPWLHVSRSDDIITRAEIERFMHVVRHNPRFNRYEVRNVVHDLCRFHNFDAHLLPDDDIVFWYFASEYMDIPEPVMDRFMRVVRHNPDFHHTDVNRVLHNVYMGQSIYSADLRQLIERAYETTR